MNRRPSRWDARSCRTSWGVGGGVVSPDPGQGLRTRLALRGQLPRFLRDKPVGELRQRPAQVRLGPRDPLVPRVYRRSCDPEGPCDPRLTVLGPVNPLTEQPKRRTVALLFTLCHASTGLVNPHSPVNKNRREESLAVPNLLPMAAKKLGKPSLSESLWA